jgi:hypothetical protein
MNYLDPPLFDFATSAVLETQSAGLSEGTVARQTELLRARMGLPPCVEITYVCAVLRAPRVWGHVFVALHETDHEEDHFA